MDYLNQLTSKGAPLSREALNSIKNLTQAKEIYSCWESNDMGEDFKLYTGTDADGVTTRYFLNHYEREWWGGWTTNDKSEWYEITRQEYETLYRDYPKA